MYIHTYVCVPILIPIKYLISRTTSLVGTCNCGIPNKPNRISGGSETEPHEYPWVVYLNLPNEKGCGGSIISDRHVLTAAHCVDGDVTASDLSVYIGTHDISNPNQVFFVSTIDVNPSWTGNATTGSDSAVLTLSETLVFSETVRPLCLSVDPSSSYAGQAAVASGWGLDDNGEYPDKLRDVDVEIITNEECRSYGEKWSNVKE